MAKAKHDEELTLAISGRSWSRAVKSCEEYEIEAASDPSCPLPNYGIHLLVHLLDNDLYAWFVFEDLPDNERRVNARFLWKRIPAPVKASSPELPAIWKIAQAMWKTSYTEVYRAMNAHPFTGVHQDLVRLLAESYRQRNFVLIAKGYTAVGLSTVADMLGISPTEAQEACAKFGWSVDAASGTVTPVRPAQAKDQSIGAKELQNLTEFFCYLEQQ